MKKIIAAFDGLKYSQSTASYAIQLAKEAGAHLVGIFLDDFTYHSYLLRGGSYKKVLKLKLEGDEQDQLTRHLSTESFEKSCQNAGVNYTVHHDRSLAVQELLHESIYADLLIVDKTESLNQQKEDLPVNFIKYVLADAQCPVLIVPSKFKSIEKIVLLYDGSPSSVFAIKMFSYLLPDLKKLPAEVVSVRDEDLNHHLPDDHLMKEFMKRHFPDAEYKVMNGDAEPLIIQYLKGRKQNELLVLGAYHRSVISRVFKSSMADKLMRQLKTPLFIAHT
ncbi:MAG: universal stress protein [Bacteroidetes bacterium]|jgi:nucleotide-binding universal stress UspA family protein|nr:universal stress protein [Bacteroidota bacterium]